MIPRGENLRQRILMTLTLVFLMVMGISIFSIYRSQTQHIDDKIRYRLEGTQRLLDNLVQEEAEFMEAQLTLLGGSRQLQRSWLAGDREELLGHSQPLFASLQQRYGIAHLYFIENDGTCFLRVHHPERQGDVIARDTFTRAKVKKGPAYGFELGPFGIFTLRLVMPWTIDGQIAGYLEMGMALDRIAPKLEEVMGGELAFIVKKEYLDQGAWEEGMHLLGSEAAWDEFPDAVAVSGAGRVPTTLAKLIRLPGKTQAGNQFALTKLDENKLQGGFVPLRDVRGKEVGSIAILHDMTAEVDSLYATTGFLTSVMVLLGGALFMFIYFLTGHVEKRLLATRDRLMQEIEERRQAQEELSEYRRQLEAKVTARTLDLQAINIDLQGEIAGREHAERMVREALTEWERTFNAIGDIVTIHDREMRMVRVNRAAAETFGAEPQELIGRFCYQVFRGLSSPCPGCPEVSALRSLKRHHAEIEHHNLGKTFLVTASPIFDEQGGFTGMVHIAKDITIQKQLENRLRQTQRMEAVGTLANGVTHDFNNLLTGIIGYADLCLGEAGSDSQIRGDLAEILRLAGRGADLIRQLQAFSRQQVSEPVIIDLNELVANLFKMLQRLLGEGIALQFHPAAQGRVEADPGQMEQIFINLAVNAREAMPDGGNLIIETSDEEISTDAAIRQPGMAAGAYVRLLVRDSGRGMDGATLERIFDPFYTTKNAATGAGLGLAVIFGIIKQHSGLVQAESIPGQGTSFSMYLPRAVAGDQQAEAPEMLPLQPVRRTILLVEDEPAVRNVIRRMLVKAGYLVIDSENPGAAEKLFAEKKDEIALLVTDMVMPGGSGRDLYGRLAGQAAGLKVLFMSGQLENPLVREEIMGGSLPFIAKPFSPEGLDAKIKEILR